MDNIRIISDITNDIPVRMRESYFKTNYPHIHQKIVEYTSDLDIRFIQRVWHWVNHYPTNYICKCGKSTTFNKNWKDGYKVSCSAKCAQSNQSVKDKRRDTNIERWGVDNIAKSVIIKDKTSSTNLERYGHTSSFQNENVRNKWSNNIKNKYGVDHYFKSDDFKKKSIATNNIRYGVDHYVQSNSYIENTIATNNERYGVDWYTQTEDYLIKSKETNNEKYGANHYSMTDEYKMRVNESNLLKYKSKWYYQSDDFKKKSLEKIMSKYGVVHYTKSKEYRDYINSDEYRCLRLLRRASFYEERGFIFISSERIGHARLYSNLCGHEFNIHPTNLQRRLLCGVVVCTECNPIDTRQSGQEINIINWLKDINVLFKSNDRNSISPYELDVLIGSVALEYNGLYWHSEMYKERSYHLNKTNKCIDSNIDLIHIWEDDWLYKQEIIKSIILSRIGKIDNIIYSRKCIIKEVDDVNIVRNFLDINHIQGYTSYGKCVGLYYDNILVSCMLFHNTRGRIELVRFVTILNTIVVGSASKLFKYYVSNYECHEIISFADRSMFSGGVYKMLGFKFIYRTKPNYWWVIDGIRKHRFNYNKKRLIKDGFDPNKSESEIMCDRGYYKIYGCGQDKWLWSR